LAEPPLLAVVALWSSQVTVVGIHIAYRFTTAVAGEVGTRFPTEYEVPETEAQVAPGVRATEHQPEREYPERVDAPLPLSARELVQVWLFVAIVEPEEELYE
jgi:hypothetical protein